MIWFRRTLALPLIIFFVILFVLSLVTTQVNGTLGDTSFYHDQMKKADVYDYLYDDLLPAALEDIDENDTSDSIPVDLSRIRDNLVTAAREAVPPEWIQEQFEMLTDAVVPYFLGSKDEFTYTIPLDERAEAAVDAIKTYLIRGDAFSSIYDDLISYASERVVDNLEAIPYELALDKQDVETALTEAFPTSWMVPQLENAVDSLWPYLTNESNQFVITFHFDDRVDAIAARTAELISSDETYDYLMEEMVKPTIEESIPATVILPFNITISRDEVMSAITASAIEEVMSRSWVEEQLRGVIDQIASYAKGEIDRVDVTVDLSEVKISALDLLLDQADERLEEIYDGLPTCSRAEFSNQAYKLNMGELPDCRPAAVSYVEFKGSFGVDVDAVIRDALDELIAEEIPNEWVFTDSELRDSLGEENQDFLDNMRDYVANGWSLTEADLFDELTPEDHENLDEVREYIGSGYTITQQDVREELTEEELQDQDDMRDLIDSVRSWLWACWLVCVLVLIGIGFLCGSNWRDRLLWVLGLLFVTSLIVFVATIVIDTKVTKSEIENAVSKIEIEDYEHLETAVVEKSQEMAENIAHGVTSAIEGKSVIAMIIGGVGMGATIGGSIYWNRRKNMLPPSSDGGQPMAPDDLL